MFIPSIKEIVVMILVVVLIGTPVTWAIENKQMENMAIEEMTNIIRERDATGFRIDELSNIDDLKVMVEGHLYNVLPSSEVKPHMVKGVSTFITLNPVEALGDFWDYIFNDIMHFLPKGMPNPFR